MAVNRWDKTLGKDVEREDIDAFLSEIEQVCMKHGFSISHEDSGGVFLISSFNKDNIEWLKDAHIEESAHKDSVDV